MIHANNKENLTSEYRITLVKESRQEVTNGVTYLERDYRRGDGKPVRAFLVVVSPDVVANIAVSAAPQGKGYRSADPGFYPPGIHSHPFFLYCGGGTNPEPLLHDTPCVPHRKRGRPAAA